MYNLSNKLAFAYYKHLTYKILNFSVNRTFFVNRKYNKDFKFMTENKTTL